jgi:hypothetical protein
VAFHREIGRIDLQHETALDDVPVFDAQCVRQRCQIFLECVVVFVVHRSRDDARRGRRHERLHE